MPLTTPEGRSVLSFRLILVCLAAVSVSLPMAWISLAKVLLFVFGLMYLIGNQVKKRSAPVFDEQLWTPRVILAILLAFSLSLFWTDVDTEFAWLTLVKHGKLLEVLLLISLIRTAREARIGVTAFAAGQAFVLLNSWLLAAGVPIPWVSNPAAQYVVFAESYLDQSIMFAASAAVFWQLRADRLWPRWLASLFAVAALLNVFLLLQGRTGYVVAMVVLSLAAMWAMPRRWRLPILIITPLLVLSGAYFGSHQAQQGLSRIITESQSYAKQPEIGSSSGWRLNAWHRSLQAMQASPWIGHGIGSWTPAVKRFEGETAAQAFGTGNSSNPHQEYLLWGVELGIGGTLLLLALLIGVLRDAQRFSPSIRQATLSVLAAVAVACLFNSALYDDLMGDFLCVALGLLMALGLRSASSASMPTLSAPTADRS